jgi:hypothetical protein
MMSYVYMNHINWNIGNSTSATNGIEHRSIFMGLIIRKLKNQCLIIHFLCVIMNWISYNSLSHLSIWDIFSIYFWPTYLFIYLPLINYYQNWYKNLNICFNGVELTVPMTECNSMKPKVNLKTSRQKTNKWNERFKNKISEQTTYPRVKAIPRVACTNFFKMFKKYCYTKLTIFLDMLIIIKTMIK